MYVFKTDKGYIKGDLLQGVEFTNKKNARKFTYAEAGLYGGSIAADVSEFYGCSTVDVEEVED